MTTDREMAKMYADQEEVIAALHAMGDHNLAGRLERCAMARRDRHHGGSWPRLCCSVACAWCRRPTIRSWWGGFCDWTAAIGTSSLAIIQIDSSAGLPAAVRQLRRGLRDVRDRTARRWRRWREVCFAGLADGDHMALLLISHQGVERREVDDVLRRRWPTVVVKSLEHEVPTVTMSAADAADLGQRRRGIEPLRIVVMPQHHRQVVPPVLEPMPVLV
jgi:hypothetical protein